MESALELEAQLEAQLAEYEETLEAICAAMAEDGSAELAEVWNPLLNGPFFRFSLFFPP